MITITAAEARLSLNKLLDQVAETHQAVLITSKDSNDVLLSEDDWRAIEETMTLLSIPGLRKSIIDGINIPLEELSEEVEC